MNKYVDSSLRAVSELRSSGLRGFLSLLGREISPLGEYNLERCLPLVNSSRSPSSLLVDLRLSVCDLESYLPLADFEGHQPRLVCLLSFGLLGVCRRHRTEYTYMVVIVWTRPPSVADERSEVEV